MCKGGGVSLVRHHLNMEVEAKKLRQTDREIKLLSRLDIQKIQDYALMAPKSNKVLEILQMESGDNGWVDVVSVTSAMRTIADNVEEHGYYKFTDIYPSGNYRVVFAASDREGIPVYQSPDCHTVYRIKKRKA